LPLSTKHRSRSLNEEGILGRRKVKEHGALNIPDHRVQVADLVGNYKQRRRSAPGKETSVLAHICDFTDLYVRAGNDKKGTL